MRKIKSFHIYTVSGKNNVSVHRTGENSRGRTSKNYYNLTFPTLERLSRVTDRYGVASYDTSTDGYSNAMVLI
jgi:hypothetical protein